MKFTVFVIFATALALIGTVQTAGFNLGDMTKNLGKMGNMGDMAKNGALIIDFIGFLGRMGPAGAQILQNMKPEDYQEIITAFKDPKETEAYFKICKMMVEGKSIDDVAGVLMDTGSGIVLVNALTPLLPFLTEGTEKYGPLIKQMKEGKRK